MLAEDDELKGVGEDHRAVQVAPLIGLQRISGGAAVGAAGRETVTLPACMSGLPDGHVALAAGVLDPWVHTGTRVTWEKRTIACVAPETGTGREERRPLSIQVNGRGEDMAFWPPDCAARAGGTYTLNGEQVDLRDEAECGPWERVFDGCSVPPPGPSATANPPPNWQFRNVGYAQNGSAVCPSGYAGTAYWTEQWERREMNKDDGAGWFVVASRQQPGTSRQWNHGNCLASGTGACPSGQVGTATWTQAYGQAQAWNYSGCTVVVAQNPGDPGGGDPGDGGPGSTGPGTGDGNTSTSSDVPSIDSVSDPGFTGGYTKVLSSELIGSFSGSDRGDTSWLFGEFVPSMAAVIEDVVVVSEDAVREPVVAQELPDVLDRVEFRRSGRERQQGDVVGDLERRGGMPACPVEDDDGMGAGFDGAGDLGEMGAHCLCIGPGHDKAGRLAFLRADGAEDIGRGCAPVLGR